jgi:hypothetical protein
MTADRHQRDARDGPPRRAGGAPRRRARAALPADGDCKDPARTALDLSRIKAMNVEKYLTLMGRPTQIVELTNPDEAMVELAKLGVLKPVDAGDGDRRRGLRDPA